ncbi:coenzyme F420-0:L-glutamate ligase [Methanosarcinaceae archaeon]|nr:coenzyme F420-0:L-glutamate ligase [Methanosarcinaceae archaeon]MBQ3621041.1 coenzyme F420-0:L-glutamate ligase [Methanosarcinaceae archaeon]
MIPETKTQESCLRIFGLRSRLIRKDDDICKALEDAFSENGISPQEGDIIVIAESALATAEGNIIPLADIVPSDSAINLAADCRLDPREAELIIREADYIFGGVSGAILTIKNGLLCPNAGIDNSNAPEGYVTLYPADPTKSAVRIRKAVSEKYGCNVGIIVADSRTQPLRLGCTGVALGAAGFLAVEDKRGEEDLYGRKMTITRIAVADNLATAAEIVMGETNASIPFALIRDSGIRMIPEESGIELIPTDQCLYFGSFRKGFRTSRERVKSII